MLSRFTDSTVLFQLAPQVPTLLFFSVFHYLYGSLSPQRSKYKWYDLIQVLFLKSPQRPAGYTHSSTRVLRPPEQLERPAGLDRKSVV